MFLADDMYIIAHLVCTPVNVSLLCCLPIYMVKYTPAVPAVVIRQNSIHHAASLADVLKQINNGANQCKYTPSTTKSERQKRACGYNTAISRPIHLLSSHYHRIYLCIISAAKQPPPRESAGRGIPRGLRHLHRSRRYAERWGHSTN